MRRTTSLLLSCLTLPLTSACAQFDREDRIEDVRVLAVRTEPAEIFLSPVYLLPPEVRPPLPDTEVAVEVFAFEPRGGDVTVHTRVCPRSDGLCVATLPEKQAADLEGLYAPRVVETGPADLSQDPSGRIEGLDFSFRFTTADALAFMPAGIFSSYAYVSLDVESRSHAEVPREAAYKRLPVSLDLWDPALPPAARDQLLDLLTAADENLDIQLCETRVPDEEYVEGPTHCLEPREANQNPSLLGFHQLEPDEEPQDGVVTEDEAEPDIGLDDVIFAEPGSVIALEPVFEPGVQERYQIISFDIEDSSPFVENVREDPVVSWYTTRGDASTGQSTLLLGGNLSVAWTLPGSAQPGERDTLVAVVRDQRGGTAVARVTVEYE